MKKWIERALNIHPGDLGRGTLLCSCLFLVMTTYKVGGVAGAALFLSRFQAKQLAYADIASALVVALVVAGYVLVARRVPLLGLLLASTLFARPSVFSGWSGAAPSRVGSFPDISLKPWPGTSALRVCCWGWHCFC